MRRYVSLAVVAALIWLSAPTVVLGDYYDTFDDGDYTGDPNVWDIDNPGWTVYVPLVGPNAVAVFDGWLRLWTAPGWISDYSFLLCYVEEPGDPCDNPTMFHNTAPHYLVSRTKVNDPNGGGRGQTTLLMHGDPNTWNTYLFEYEAYANDFILTSLSGFDFSFGQRRKMGDPNDPNDPNAPDETNGFWMCFQYDPTGTDGMADPNDPNNHWIRGAAWNGDKFDWDGEWFVEVNVVDRWGEDPVYGYQLRTGGLCGVVAGGSLAIGLIPDVSFDNIECRWGTFTNVSHSLDLTVSNGHMGTVTIDPDLLDDPDNDPNDLGELRRYTDGTEVVLSAEPLSGKSLKHWIIYDPNHPGDANYVAEDTNTVLYLTMDADWQIEAAFKCGGGVPPFIAMTLVALAMGVAIRRGT